MTDSFDEPEGIAPRGTVVVAAGRGETTAAYQRFGRRIAADGYRVRVLPDITADLAGSLAAAGKLLDDDALPAPKVIAGSDTGALFALALAERRTPGLDAVVLAGRPTEPPAGQPGGQQAGQQAGQPGVDLLGWDAEVEARTACPNHQRVLGNGEASLFSAPIPTELIGLTGDAAGLPVLALHGDADPISPLEHITYPGPVVAIAGGRHDVLNDVTHRTVAATVVLFLERLRLVPRDPAGLPAAAQLPLIARIVR